MPKRKRDVEPLARDGTAKTVAADKARLGVYSRSDLKEDATRGSGSPLGARNAQQR
jgi:hypothetical protein